MSNHLHHTVGAVVVLLPSIVINLSSQADTQAAHVAPPVSTPAAVPRPAAGTTDRRPSSYQMSAVYDRVNKTTRLTVVPAQNYRPSSDRASVSFAMSITYPGRDLTTAPDSVEFLFTAFAPARSGWALAHPGTLKITVDDSLNATIPSSSYQRLNVQLTARGRTEMIVFRVATPQVMALAAATEGKLKIGRFTIKLEERGLEAVRALAARLAPAHP